MQVAEVYIESTREERLATENLALITLPIEDVVWEEDRKELWVGDKLFDVASFTIKGGVYHLTGVFDEEETAIADSLLHFISSKKGSQFLHFLLLLQCFSFSIFSFRLSPRIHQNEKGFSFYLSSLSSPSCLVLVPPPRPISTSF